VCWSSYSLLTDSCRLLLLLLLLNMCRVLLLLLCLQLCYCQ
jgi:hypothetical protein